MRFLDYILLLRQRWRLAAVIVGVVAFASMFMSLTQEALFVSRAKVQLLPLTPSSAVNEITEEQTNLGNEAQLLLSDRVATQVGAKLGIVAEPAVLANQIQVDFVDGTDFLIVSSTSIDAEYANALVTAFIEEYIAVRRIEAVQQANRLETQYRGELSILEDEISLATGELLQLSENDPSRAVREDNLDAMRARSNELRRLIVALQDTESIQQGTAEIVNEPKVDLVAAGSHARNLILGILVGVPVALGVILLLDAMKDTIRSSEDAETHTGLPVVGLIPFDVGWRDPDEPWLATVAESGRSVAEAYRTLRLNLESQGVGRKIRRILVTSPGPGEGKSATAANLAVTWADAGVGSLLVDADLRRPRAHEFMEVSRKPGLSEVLLKDLPILKATRTPQRGLGLVAAGSPIDRADQAFTGARLDRAMARFVQVAAKVRRQVAGRASDDDDRRAVIIIDAPPVLHAAETSALAAAADGVIIVLQANGTQRLAAARAVEQIQRAGGNLLGVVLVGVRASSELGISDRIYNTPYGGERRSGESTSSEPQFLDDDEIEEDPREKRRRRRRSPAAVGSSDETSKSD